MQKQTSNHLKRPDFGKCNPCNGSGLISCPKCDGQGRVSGMFGDKECNNCAGSGSKTCPNCRGKGESWVSLH